eukprot:CAMPEP_0115311450 /NCGR_PEP_ID=MMETSP0270-20121206/75340_1 /TAXON_ID=71861 /ORGANISM="Scrippsiella trochoidea, Strain CCMP3099" /LENGTH=52 /DNA_ID=CAMNT_0002730279 /DNA_START=88 /DNA_END=243 /DNA_ORIENTATION=+
MSWETCAIAAAGADVAAGTPAMTPPGSLEMVVLAGGVAAVMVGAAAAAAAAA